MDISVYCNLSLHYVPYNNFLKWHFDHKHNDHSVIWLQLTPDDDVIGYNHQYKPPVRATSL